MSGSTGNDRIEGRETFDHILESYKEFIKNYPLFVKIDTTGSYNSDLSKTSFGDMDLVVHFDYTKDKDVMDDIEYALEKNNKKKRPDDTTTVIKRIVKKHFMDWLDKAPETKVVPFAPGPDGNNKHAGKRFGNTGELVTISYKADDETPAAQIDNMVALDDNEYVFKKQFLDMPAAKQGLMLGLVKSIMDQDGPEEVLARVGIDVDLEDGWEYEFNLSSKALTLRKVKYDPEAKKNGKYKVLERETIKSWANYDILDKLLGAEFSLDDDFETLVNKTVKKISTFPPSKQKEVAKRIFGTFASMITVKAGEVGKPKGDAKIQATQYLADALGIQWTPPGGVEESFSMYDIAALFL